MSGEKKKSVTYSDAGVDIDKANELVGSIKEIVASTYSESVKSEIGGFGAIFQAPVIKGMSTVNIHSSTDGVGTKLKIAFALGKHDTVGIDLVAMCVNDVLVSGVKPLFFLDYFATGKLEPDTIKSVIVGVANGCLQAGCALIGGETAEMPGMYPDGEYDLSGFTVGVEDEYSIPHRTAQIGDSIIGLGSSGLHSNGFSLVRKICFENMGLSVESNIEEFGRSLGEEMLEPTRIYVKPVLALLQYLQVNGIANITGGGFIDNIPRMMSGDVKARIRNGSWVRQPVFKFLQENGPVDKMEMLRTFNCGIGMVISVPDRHLQEAFSFLYEAGETPYYIGDVVKRDGDEPQVEFI